LKERFNDAIKLMHKLGSKGSIKKADYDTWPLFKQFRESKHYVRAYTELFGANTNVKPITEAATGGLRVSEVADPKVEISKKKPAKASKRAS
jgi:hypothetical protein